MKKHAQEVSVKKLKIYLDTSIISFVYAKDSPEKQDITKEFFHKYLTSYDVYISGLVLAEIEATSDESLKKMLKETIVEYNLIVLEIDPDRQQIIFDLARQYVKDNIIPVAKFDDAVHVAICVLYEFDILLSWNFRHLANIRKQIQINAVNKREGYLKELFLLNPMEVIYEKGH